MQSNKSRIYISAATLVALVGGIFAYVANSGKPAAVTTEPATTKSVSASDAGQNQSSQPVATTQTPADIPTSARASRYYYKNGTYAATGTYDSPGGTDNLGVSLTIKNDVVTAATVTNEAGDGRSSRYQDRFISGFKQYVIGQPVDSISLDVVSGSSLTPIGFMDALNQIKAQARA